MGEFSISDAALHGFKVPWERPRALVLWAILQSGVSLAYWLSAVFLYGPWLAKVQTLEAAPRVDPVELDRIASGIAPFNALSLIVLLTLSAIVQAAMNRAVFRPEEDGFGYLRLGLDELRQFVLLLSITGVMLAAIFICFFAAGLLSSLFLGSASLTAIPEIAGLLLPIGLAVTVFLGVRFSLAAPMTFATGKVSLQGSWTLTRGRFWPILGTHALATAMILVVGLLGYAVAFASAAAMGGGMGAIHDLVLPNLSNLQTFLSPARWVQIVLRGALFALVWPLAFTPAAVIYRSLAGRGAAAAFA